MAGSYKASLRALLGTLPWSSMQVQYSRSRLLPMHVGESPPDFPIISPVNTAFARCCFTTVDIHTCSHGSVHARPTALSTEWQQSLNPNHKHKPSRNNRGRLGSLMHMRILMSQRMTECCMLCAGCEKSPALTDHIASARDVDIFHTCRLVKELEVVQSRLRSGTARCWYLIRNTLT